MFSIELSRTDTGTLFRLNGRLTIDSSPELRTKLLIILEQTPQLVLVDLEHVDFIDSSGLVTLMEALRIARRNKTTLQVNGLHGPVLHLLKLTGLLGLFEGDGEASAGLSSEVQ
jgi:anti-sigma B factor antagonist